MNPIHQGLAAGDWYKRSLVEQMANIGSEIERAIRWREKKNSAYSLHALERGTELLWLTIEDPDNRLRLRELCRVREILNDYFFGSNMYASSDVLWQKYFLPFMIAARK